MVRFNGARKGVEMYPMIFQKTLFEAKEQTEFLIRIPAVNPTEKGRNRDE